MIHCVMKTAILVIILVVVGSDAAAQEWQKRTVADVRFEVPEPFREIDTDNAYEIHFDTTNVYISVTRMYDSTDVPPVTQLQRSRYYAATAATASIRLRGKMVENKDSMIGDNHAYFTAIDVTMYDSAVARYQLLQYMPNDTLYAFSSQHVLGDELGEALSQKFFNNIRFSGASKGGVPPWLIAIIAAPIAVGAVLLSRRKRNTPGAATA